MTVTTTPVPADTSPAQLEEVLRAAAGAAPLIAQIPPSTRAAALLQAADALQEHAAELVDLAVAETHLPAPRLSGELLRTATQLRLFAQLCLDGDFLDVRIDEPDPDFVLGPRPDLRRYRAPIGPVLVFGASNFPFAFSVAGGDTASALAAGCPVVLKAHPGHPRLSQRTGAVVAQALESAGLPAATLQVVHGQQAGLDALADPRICAAGFTGSTAGGTALARVAADRPRPIPFYGELGSVNPVVVTPAALAARGAEIAAGYVTSVTGSAGQLCTKPGFLFVPTGHGLEDALVAAAEEVQPQPLLHPGISAGYAARRTAVLSTPAVDTLVAGELLESDGVTSASPTFARTTPQVLLEQGEALLDEAFGPLSVVVEYDPARPGELLRVLDEGFPGSLTATVHTGPGEDSPELHALVQLLTTRVGRLLFDAWPTGVAVTPAMTHGGPYPASTNAATTSVGTAAVERFQRAVTYQDAPAHLLPAALRDDNPWGLPRHVEPAGRSRTWGQLPH